MQVAPEVRQLQLQGDLCIEIKGLRKVFPTPDGQLVAVAGLHLTMYEGQIFALLGHNGQPRSSEQRCCPTQYVL